MQHLGRSLRPALSPRTFALLALATLALAAAGCEEKKPTRMEIRPEGPIVFEDRATTKKIHLAFFTDDDKPYVRKPDAVYDAEDPSVVTVTAEPDGATASLVAKKTGSTKVTVRAFGLSGSIDVTSKIIGGIELEPGLPKTLRVGKKVTAKAVVKDDRGEVVEKAPVAFSASDYCISVYPDGTVEAVSVGQCDLVAKTAGFSTRHTFNVK